MIVIMATTLPISLIQACLQSIVPRGKKRGRRPLPEDLPRERVEYDLADDQKACPCCKSQMHRMGEAVTEQLHIEVKAKVLQNVRFKYACRHCDRTGINTPVVIAPMPPQPLPGSIATASTLAFALVHKYVDGTPLYRVAQTFERAGVPISRGALAHWVIGSSERHLHRIYDALRMRLRLQPLIHGDETTVQVLKEKNKEATSTVLHVGVPQQARTVTSQSCFSIINRAAVRSTRRPFSATTAAYW